MKEVYLREQYHFGRKFDTLVEKNATLTKLLQKLLQDLARECINFHKILQNFLQELCFLQNFCKSCVFFAKLLQELCSV